MQWSGEVLPEPAMIPDLSVFLRSVSARARVVTNGGYCRAPSARISEAREALFVQAREKFPALLTLPFLPAPVGEQKALTADQPGALLTAHSDGR